MEQDSVRRCRQCGAPAVVIVNRWTAKLLGVLPLPHNGMTEHQCQSCGAQFTLRPWLLLWFGASTLNGLSLVGAGTLGLIAAPIAFAVQGAAEAFVVLVIAAIGLAAGLVVLWFGAGPQVHAWLNPIVPGALMPELRYGPPECYRRCFCGTAAPRISQTAYMIIQIPGGRSDTHQCPNCGHTFTVPNRVALVTPVAMTMFLWGIAVFLSLLLPFRELNSGHFFVLGVLGLGGMMGALIALISVLLRRRHPVV